MGADVGHAVIHDPVSYTCQHGLSFATIQVIGIRHFLDSPCRARVGARVFSTSNTKGTESARINQRWLGHFVIFLYPPILGGTFKLDRAQFAAAGRRGVLPEGIKVSHGLRKRVF